MARLEDFQRVQENDASFTFLQLFRPEAPTMMDFLGMEQTTNAEESIHDAGIMDDQHNHAEPSIMQPPTVEISDLIEGLKQNTHIEKVRIYVQDHPPLPSFSLLKAVGSLPKLLELKVESYCGLMDVSVEGLTIALQAAPRLEEFQWWDLRLVGQQKSAFDQLGRALRHHECLQRVTIYNCPMMIARRASEETTSVMTEQHYLMDPLLQALSTILTLEKVYITAAASAATNSSLRADFSNESLECLCQSKSLQELGLWKFSFASQSTLICMAYSICHLKILEIGMCPLGIETDKALAHLLDKNTCLEEMDLHIDSSSNRDPSCDLRQMATALFSNTTLKRLKIWGEVSRSGQEALKEMIQRNYVMETFRLLDADPDITAQIDFYIQLNRSGRRNLLQEGERSSQDYWKDFLLRNHYHFNSSNIRDSRHLSFLFYYLSKNPSFLLDCALENTK